MSRLVEEDEEEDPEMTPTEDSGAFYTERSRLRETKNAAIEKANEVLSGLKAPAWGSSVPRRTPRA